MNKCEMVCRNANGTGGPRHQMSAWSVCPMFVVQIAYVLFGMELILFAIYPWSFEPVILFSGVHCNTTICQSQASLQSSSSVQVWRLS